MSSTHIVISGARENNLKGISVSIPKNALVVITGLSGSGKSSLAFQTLYAEGQRRYLESFSNYARQFIGGLERPDVDYIEGLSPVISIEQKSVNKNPRSTVGTITEVYDFLRLLYAKVGTAYSYVSNMPMQKLTEDEIIIDVLKNYNNKKIVLLAPLVRGRKGHYRELFESFAKKGYTEMNIDGVLTKLAPKLQLDRYKIHDIDLVMDKLAVNEENKERLEKSIRASLKEGEGSLVIIDFDTKKQQFYSKHLLDLEHGISYEEPSANSFSFNSTYGACPACKGLGEEFLVSRELMIPDEATSVMNGGIVPLGEYRPVQLWETVKQYAKMNKIDLSVPILKLTEREKNLLLFGNELGEDEYDKEIPLVYSNFNHGVSSFVYNNFYHSESDWIKNWAETFMQPSPCPTCEGSRLKKESLFFKIKEKNISELSQMGLDELLVWFDGIEKHFSDNQNKIAKDILKEIRDRLGFLINVGLHYLNLTRGGKTLSGGEAQRIRLATQIGSELMGITYILDEPSIGLHPRDNDKLIKSLKKLRDLGNNVIVVEHDKEIMLESDFLIDIGPLAGEYGGEIIAAGAPKEFMKMNTSTADYLAGKLDFVIPKKRKQSEKWIEIKGATGHNLKKIDVKIPLGVLCCITGVSGSGKSSLISETLQPILSQYFYKSHALPLPYKSITGLENINKVISIDQSPIGRTPRSNPATYMKVFDLIRTLYSDTMESKIRGYKPGRFSFNVKGGRCEGCEGAGLKTIEMNFLPDIQVPCEKCQGKRYNRETLDIRYKHLSIYDVLELSITEAVQIFEHLPSIYQKLKTLEDVGLGYLKLGQPSTTISGGEAQRVKLASELCKRDTGNTMYILDEPTTGLHFQDIQMLYNVLKRLVDKGNSILIIEHNLDIIKMADYIIDMGPEGGKDGGNIVAVGSPEEISKIKSSLTGLYLEKELNGKGRVQQH
ncbi:MAG: excinuclease ABC subunit UvrA [Chitinophagales bacterium]|jgi:excinuclease ABC subunit A|nr:excinuclease ABC subunit UvrA [Sphingobacteriales bacterium]